MTFSLSKDGITAVPLVPSDAIDTSRTEPQLFLVCDQPETRALLATLPPQSAAFCYADEVQLRNVVTALQAGAADYFAWPDDFGELVERIRELQALDRREAANGSTFGDPRWNPEPRRMGGYPRQTSLAASGGLSISTPISLLMTCDRGSRFIEPMNARSRSITIAFTCRPANLP